LLTKNNLAILVGLQIAIFLSALDQTVLNVAIPKMAQDLLGFDKSAWIITAYLLSSTIATPVSGKLADIYGAKSVLLVATFFFGLASALCGSAGLIDPLLGLDAIDQLILARALQGIAGGAMIGLCFISIGDLFPVAERGKYQGFLAAAFIVAALVGPALGGWLTDRNSWRVIFYLNIPLSLLGCLLFKVSFPLSLRPRAKAVIDYVGILFFVLFITPMILAASEIGKIGTIGPIPTLELVGSLAMFLAFLWRESKAPEPLIPLSLFKDRLIAISLVTVFVTGIGLFGSMLLLAMILQQMVQMSGIDSGLILTPLIVVVALASIGGGLIVAKTKRYKLLCLVSLLLLGAGSALLAWHVQVGPIKVFDLLLDAAIGGIGLGLLLPVHTILIQNVAPPESMGVATSMTQFFRSLGGTIGTGLMSAVMLSLVRQGTLQQAVVEALVLYVVTVALAVVLNLFLPVVPLVRASKTAQKESKI
jgi:EmrB/QacA subfamily drug resistance transporter